MRKLRSDSNWNRLTGPQREMVEKWLFDEHLSYDATLARVKCEFGLVASRMSLCRYHQRRVREREVADLVTAQARAVSDLASDPNLSTDSVRTAAVNLMAVTTLTRLGERRALKEMASMTRLLLRSEDNDIRRRRLKLAQEQFHYEAGQPPPDGGKW
jgi:hypothetical protein